MTDVPERLQSLRVEGVDYETVVPEHRPSRAQGADPRCVRAAIPGLVAAVLVKPGERVHDRTGLLVLEAMKMENAIRAAADGVVRRVHVEAGQLVAKGQLLVELEPGPGGSRQPD